ncbi:MAG: LysM domain-containing protein, partial [Lachnospiraceae bacterium]|nr:LysM domain-containing protein [Lachnospiraceae bacterium]
AVAAKLGTTVEALVKKNGIKDANKIYAGQTIVY